MINAIIVRCQSVHKTSVPLTRRGRPWQSALKPQGSLANKYNKCIMKALYHNNTSPAMTIIVTGASITTIQAQQMQEEDTLHRKAQADRANTCPRSSATNMESTTKLHKKNCRQNKNKAIMTHTPCVTRATIAGQAVNRNTWQSQWHRPVMKEQAQATTTKTPFW